ncbi:MAG: hypothetical protein OXF79_20260 [Chloroflexi bacterium]|nr:hypothetical protein [Chloroflexota bacterium]
MKKDAEVGLVFGGRYSTYLNRRDYFAMAMQYRRAGYILAKHCVAHHDDRIVPPLLMCYRHSLELYLKSCLRGAKRSLEKNHEHSLDRLWKEMQKLLADANEDDPVALVDTAIAELDKVDPKGTSFRYPDEAAGEPLGEHAYARVGTLPILLERVEFDLGTVADFLSGGDNRWS